MRTSMVKSEASSVEKIDILESRISLSSISLEDVLSRSNQETPFNLWSGWSGRLMPSSRVEEPPLLSTELPAPSESMHPRSRSSAFTRVRLSSTTRSMHQKTVAKNWRTSKRNKPISMPLTRSTLEHRSSMLLQEIPTSSKMEL